jgi:hypothetical protein
MLRLVAQMTGLMVAVLVLSGCLPGVGLPDTLTYNGVTEYSVPVGGTLPGTDIRYVGYRVNGAEVLINDQQALKKLGDSLDWKGTPTPGVDVSLAQRIVFISEQRLQTVGTVRVTVQNAAPASAQFPDQPSHSYKVVVTYTVKRGEAIPGTLISYAGKTENGAELRGVTGYPYRKLGDSIGWSGRLRADTYLQTTLRVIAYTDDFLQVGGLATLGVTRP